MQTCDVGRLHQLVGDERWAEFRETNSKGDCGFVQCAASNAPAPSDDACAKMIVQDSLTTDPEAGLAKAEAEAETDAKLQPTNPLEKIFDQLQADTKADLQDATTEDNTNVKVNIVADDNIKVRPKLQITETLHNGSPQQPSSSVHSATADDRSSGEMAAHISIRINRRWAIRAGIGLALAGVCCLCFMAGVPCGPNSCSLARILQPFGQQQQQHGEYAKLPSQESACEMDEMNSAGGPTLAVEVDIDAQCQDQEMCKTESGTLACCIHCNAKVVESKSKFCSECGQLLIEQELEACKTEHSAD